MLPSLALPLGDGYLLARDVPVAVFFADYPADDQQQDLRMWERWSDALLTRVVVEPILTPELVQRLGSDRESLARCYLAAIGWLREREQAPEACTAMGEIPELSPEILRQVLPRVPTGRVRADLIALAEKSGVAPHVVWSEWTASQFYFSFKVHLPEQSLTLVNSDDYLPLVQRIGKLPDTR